MNTHLSPEVKMQIHSSITEKRIVQLAEDNNAHCMNMGVCIACGEERDSCEPDARNYECEYCGENQVQGWMVIMERGLWNEAKTILADAIAQRADEVFRLEEEDDEVVHIVETYKQKLVKRGIEEALDKRLIENEKKEEERDV